MRTSMPDPYSFHPAANVQTRSQTAHVGKRDNVSLRLTSLRGFEIGVEHIGLGAMCHSLSGSSANRHLRWIVL